MSSNQKLIERAFAAKKIADRRKLKQLWARALDDKEISIEEFLSIATWVFRQLPDKFRREAVISLMCRVGDAWIAVERENVAPPDSALH